MPRRLVEPELVLATHNWGKLEEFKIMLAVPGVVIRSAGELGLPEPEETGSTFEENATLKAATAMRATGLPALGDDSGLVVRGLGGAPGIYSARWAGPGRDFSIGIARIHRELLERFGSWERADRRAAFVAVLSLVWPDGHTETVEGRVDGSIVDTPRGDLGFGYDPIFVPDGQERTFAEMPPELKHGMSHRRLAIDLMLSRIT